MSDVYVEQARGWASQLVRSEIVGPGDLENAMRRIEAKYGVPYSTLWALRYRKPKDMLVTAWFGLKAAYEAECQRQMRKLRHEIEITKAIAGPLEPSVRKAQALVDASDDD
jgi:hypothetical protein